MERKIRRYLRWDWREDGEVGPNKRLTTVEARGHLPTWGFEPRMLRYKKKCWSCVVLASFLETLWKDFSFGI